MIKNTNITINVRDMEESISFYKSIGFTLKQRWSNYYAQLVAPDIVLGLHPTKESDKSVNSKGISIGFTTDNFDETKGELSKLGISFMERTEEGGNFLHFNDPDGTSLYFIQPKW